MVLAADRRQARTVFRYIAGFIDGVAMLARMVESRTAEAIHLANGIESAPELAEPIRDYANEHLLRPTA